MKIGFTGAGSTGKTTTLELIKDHISIPVLPSTTRQVFERWGINEDAQENMSPEDKWKLQKDIFDNRFNTENQAGEDFISDRTLLDNYAYCKLRCYLAITEEEDNELKQKVIDNLKNYDAVFYFPMTFRPVPDGLRQANFTFLTIIDSIIFSFLSREYGNGYIVPKGTPEFRAEYVLERIRSIQTRMSFGG